MDALSTPTLRTPVLQVVIFPSKRLQLATAPLSSKNQSLKNNNKLRLLKSIFPSGDWLIASFKRTTKKPHCTIILVILMEDERDPAEFTYGPTVERYFPWSSNYYSGVKAAESIPSPAIYCAGEGSKRLVKSTQASIAYINSLEQPHNLRSGSILFSSDGLEIQPIFHLLSQSSNTIIDPLGVLSSTNRQGQDTQDESANSSLNPVVRHPATSSSASMSPRKISSRSTTHPSSSSLARYKSAAQSFAGLTGSSSVLSSSKSRYLSARQSASPSPSMAEALRLGRIMEECTIEESDYIRLLRAKSLIPTAMDELNWSGRPPGCGQHVEFKPGEILPFTELGLLGASSAAEVHRVRRQRIDFARKSMKYGPRLPIIDAIQEVEHLQRLRHSHIVRLVGSYTQGRTFAILLYPVAQYDLSKFLKNIETALTNRAMSSDQYMAVVSLESFFQCLVDAMQYIHRNTTIHMDIKPRNILIKRCPGYRYDHKVYITDFGISRHFSPLEHSQTDSVTAMTRMYCAPEVSDQEKRGRSADIFSLGCVFLEMVTILCCHLLDDFVDFRCSDSGESFHANLSKVHEWANSLAFNDPFITIERRASLAKLERHQHLIGLIKAMLNADPANRPTALLLAQQLGGPNPCCSLEPEEFRIEEEHLTTQQSLAFRSESGPQAEYADPFANNKRSSFANFDTLAIMAASNGNLNVLESLLSTSININFQDSEGWGLLHCAAFEGFDSIVRLLLSKGANYMMKNQEGKTPLHLATMGLHVKVVDMLLNKCPDLWVTADNAHKSVLELANERGSVEIISLIVQKWNIFQLRTSNLGDALIQAVKERDMTFVLRLIQNGLDIDQKNSEGETALHAAVATSDFPMLDLLLTHGAKTENQLADGSTPLHTAVRFSSARSVQTLLDHNADIDLQDSSGDTPLMSAVKSDDLAIVYLLLNHGANLEKANKVGETPLLAAARYCAPETLQTLLDKGASIHKRNINGETVLHLPFIWIEEKIRLLVPRGILPDVKNNDGQTPLHLAASSGRPEVIKALLEQGATIDATDRELQTPLQSAVQANTFAEDSGLILLLERGALVDWKDDHGDSALHKATKTGWGRTVSTLLNYGADINAQNNEGERPLHAAMRPWNQSGEMARLLIQRGAEVDIEDVHGRTPLHRAALKGHFEVLQVLVELGADVSLRDRLGRKPFDCVPRTDEYNDLCRLLLKRELESCSELRTTDVIELS
jgi:ankyrin repeat protein